MRSCHVDALDARHCVYAPHRSVSVNLVGPSSMFCLKHLFSFGPVFVTAIPGSKFGLDVCSVESWPAAPGGKLTWLLPWCDAHILCPPSSNSLQKGSSYEFENQVKCREEFFNPLIGVLRPTQCKLIATCLVNVASLPFGTNHSMARGWRRPFTVKQLGFG